MNIVNKKWGNNKMTAEKEIEYFIKDRKEHIKYEIQPTLNMKYNLH